MLGDKHVERRQVKLILERDDRADLRMRRVFEVEHVRVPDERTHRRTVQRLAHVGRQVPPAG